MDLRKRILTENDCYKAGKSIYVKGLMLHSTGANNPKLSRYVDAPELGIISPNHWNRPKPDNRQVCVHGFIGYDQNKNIATYQTLPWNHRGWGGGGKSNDTHIHVEICESNLDDAVYFTAVYKEAVELFAYLCKLHGLTEKNIVDHSEGHKLGIASNHGDVMHWFPKHGKNMDIFRADVKNLLDGGKVDVEISTPQPSVDIEQLAKDTINGKYGSGDARKQALGSNYSAVQKRVNEILGTPKPAPAPKPAPKPSVNINQLARDTINGKYGSGDARKKALGSNYSAVQKRVNEILSGKATPARQAKTISQLADEVIKGLHGSGEQRRKSLGSLYAQVQHEVNRKLRR